MGPVAIPAAIVGSSLIAGKMGADATSDAAATAAASRNDELAYQKAMWERQFGEPNDALKKQMMEMLGYTWVPPSEVQSFTTEKIPIYGGAFDDNGNKIITGYEEKQVPSSDTTPGRWDKGSTNPWLQKYKQTMRGEIESGIRPSEEAARTALLDRVRSNPKGMSNQSFIRGLKDIVTEGAKQRGSAYRTGMSQTELLPFDKGMAFMNRTPYQPSAPYSPAYPSGPSAFDYGKGLFETIKQGTGLYNDLFGNRTPVMNPNTIIDGNKFSDFDVLYG